LHNRVPENVLGQVSIAPRLTATFANAVNATPALAQRVEPNNGNFTADSTANERRGFCVVGPQVAPVGMGSTDPAYRPDVSMPGLNQFLVQIPNDPANPQNQLTYTVPRQLPGQIDPQTLNPLRQNGHAVVLKRLACPYLPESLDNPYVTVDAMTQVWVNDAIRVGSRPGMSMGVTGARTPTPTAPQNHSQARLAPYLGFQPATPAALNPTTPPAAGTTFTVTQTLATPPTTTPHESFFRHNTTAPTPAFPNTDPGLLHPFSAPTQLDRKLINVSELLHVSGVRPYELTYRFATPTASGMVTAAQPHQQEVVQGFYGATGTAVPLYRMLEVLQTKPWNWGLPHSARVPGAVNVNMIWDADPSLDATERPSRVFRALLDPQTPNRFTATDANTIWRNLRLKRTPNWDPTAAGLGANTLGRTARERDEAGAVGQDRPIQGFGSGLFAANLHTPEVGGIEQTLLGRPTSGGAPIFSTALVANDPWQGLEPFRKAFSQLTTTSDAYLVVMTIGYFEVIEEGNRVLLRREAFDQVPGDLRQQFCAVIDRSMLARPVTTLDGTTGVPWFTELVQPPIELPPPAANIRRWYFRFKATAGNNTQIQVDYDGTRIALGTGSQIRLGSGANAEVLKISSLGANLGGMPATVLPAFDPATGYATVAVDRDPTQPGFVPVRTDHHPGEPITGGFIPGHPGSVRFDLNTPPFRDLNGVIRYFGRLTP
jgi:hypothetical protein